jgi:hypothetical protein
MRDVTDQSDELDQGDELEQSRQRIEKLRADLAILIKLEQSTAIRNDGVAEPRPPVLLDPNARR